MINLLNSKCPVCNRKLSLAYSYVCVNASIHDENYHNYYFSLNFNDFEVYNFAFATVKNSKTGKSTITVNGSRLVTKTYFNYSKGNLDSMMVLF